MNKNIILLLGATFFLNGCGFYPSLKLDCRDNKIPLMVNSYNNSKKFRETSEFFSSIYPPFQTSESSVSGNYVQTTTTKYAGKTCSDMSDDLLSATKGLNDRFIGGIVVSDEDDAEFKMYNPSDVSISLKGKVVKVQGGRNE